MESLGRASVGISSAPVRLGWRAGSATVALRDVPRIRLRRAGGRPEATGIKRRRLRHGAGAVAIGVSQRCSRLPGHLAMLRGVQPGFFFGLPDTKPDEAVDN